MARATFTIQRNGRKIGSASFLGKSFKAAKSTGARVLRGLGVRPNPYKTLPRLIIGETYRILRRRGIAITPAVKKQVSDFMARGYSAAQIAGAFPTPPPKGGINPNYAGPDIYGISRSSTLRLAERIGRKRKPRSSRRAGRRLPRPWMSAAEIRELSAAFRPKKNRANFGQRMARLRAKKKAKRIRR